MEPRPKFFNDFSRARTRACAQGSVHPGSREWFRYLSALPSVEEVNFWQPGGRTNFKALQPGELFLFKLHAPRNFIVGGGVFARADILPVSVAWEAFDVRNGAASLPEMRKRIAFYRNEADDFRKDYMIGCRILTQPFFFPEHPMTRNLDLLSSGSIR